MKIILSFSLLLLFVTASAQESITLEFNRPAKFQGSVAKIRVIIQENEYILKNGSSISINVTTNYSTSLKIDCKAGLGMQSSFSFIPQPNQKYEFEVGFKSMGLYIDLLSGEKSQADSLNMAQSPNQSESIRDEWLKKGGKVNYMSVMLTGTYFRMDLAKSGFSGSTSAMTGYGGGYSVSSNFIDLKMPEYTTGKSRWNSLNWGFGFDFIVYGFKLPTLEMPGLTIDMKAMVMNMRIVGNVGWTIAQGKFTDEANWKGVALTLKYRPSYDFTYTSVTMDDGNEKTTTSNGSKQLNMGGFGFDLDFTSFSANMDKLAPKPKSKISFFLLPPVGKNPLFISLSYGITFYPRNRLHPFSKLKRTK